MNSLLRVALTVYLKEAGFKPPKMDPITKRAFW